MEVESGKFNIVCDGQFGSTGKGLLSSYIAIGNHITIAVSDAAPNAGHTFYSYGCKCIVKHLPVTGIIHKRTLMYLCPGAIIDPNVLLQEIKTFNVSTDRLAIHPRCAVITADDIGMERDINSATTKLASTQSGVGSALARKINRTAKLAEDCEPLKKYIKELDLNWFMDNGCTVLMEVPQGLDLSISSGLSYPYCTSREITVSGAMSDAQVHPSYLGKVAVSIRTFPIRVGNIVINGEEVGYSGPFYPDSVETSWEKLKVEPELTTVTKRIRRVATFSMIQYKRMLSMVKPDYILLNFCNYMEKNELLKLLEELPEVTHLGFGPKPENVYLNHYGQ